MTILRVEGVTIGVDDIETSSRFCSDWGLEQLEARGSGALFRTLANQTIRLIDKHDTSLPPPPAPDVPIREVVWGVDTDAAIERIAASIGSDRNVSTLDGGIRSHDETGYCIAFRKADVAEVRHVPRPSNSYGRIERWNHFLDGYGRAYPTQICHVVLELPKEGHEKAQAFYIDRLGFKPTDIVKPTGAFLQAEGNLDHHQLFLLHRSGRPGLNHISFEVRDFDEVIEGGNFMVAQGWKEVRRMGRHTLGSNVFRFFATPMGCRFEYAADMDRVEKGFPTRVWEEAPPHHIWMIKTNADD